jgi:hypothetical protein
MLLAVADCIKNRSSEAKLERSARSASWVLMKAIVYLFDDKLETASSYGQLKCLKMYLKDVQDVGCRL